MSNKIVMIGCGGAGSNMSNVISSGINKLGDGLCPVVDMYIDATSTTIENMNIDISKLHIVETMNLSGKSIDGSGGMRASNATDIIESVKKFMDKNKIHEHKLGDFYVVSFAASSGSGSVIGPMVIKNLLSKNIPVLAVVAGDSRNMLAATNTMDTLATLDKIAKSSDKPLSMLYLNNDDYEGDMTQAEQTVNDHFFNTVASLSLFLSGKNKDIDTQDMVNLLDMSNFRPKLKIPSGIYGVVSYGGPLHDNNIKPIVARTLTDGGSVGSVPSNMLHHKHGVINSDNAISIFKDSLPLHICSYPNIASNEIAVLQKVIADYKAQNENIKTTDIYVDENSTELDDLVL